MEWEFGIAENNAEQIKEAAREHILSALDAIGMQAASLAKVELQKAPERIDTGLLRNSITHAVSGRPAAIASYSADNPSRHTGKTPEGGSYGGTAPAADDPAKPFVLVGTNVEYALYVHEGTTDMTPNRFITNAIKNNGAEFEQIMARELNTLA